MAPSRRRRSATAPSARQVMVVPNDPTRDRGGAFALALVAAARRKALRALRRLKGRVEFDLDLDDTRR